MAEVATEVDLGALPENEAGMIAEIRQRNQGIMGGTIAVDASYYGAAVSLGFDGIRSAHGIGSLDIAFQNMRLRTLYAKRGDIGNLYRADSTDRKRAKLCWLVYAESSATAHAEGQIPTLVEFSGTKGGRVMYDYARDLLFYSPDHYGTYSLVLENGAPARCF